MFHAHIKIKVPLHCHDTLFDDLFSIIEKTDTQYNSYSPGSFIDRINKNAGLFVETDETTVRLLERAKEFSEIFGGKYDITAMPLIRLWGFYDKAKKTHIPSEKELSETIKKVDYRKIETEGSRVRIAKDQEIITGSFIKAFAVDKAIDKLKQEGVADAVINAGGSTIMAINDDRHTHWNINVTKPATSDDELMKLKISNRCFSTSAQGNTFVEIGGKRYSHILNPLTGYPCDNLQTGVITGDCFSGDIISTGLFCTSPDNFDATMRKLSEQEDTEAFLIDKNNKIRYSKNLEQYIDKSL